MEKKTVMVYYGQDKTHYGKTPSKDEFVAFRNDTQELMTTREDAEKWTFFAFLRCNPPIQVSFPAIVAILRDEKGKVLEAKYLDEWDTEAKFVKNLEFPKS